MTRVKRYEWNDALIKAEKSGHLEPGAVNFCLRLSKAVRWEPKDGMPSGLYWKNNEAFRDVGTSRSTYFRYKESLFETGFLTEKKGNIIPLVPDLSQIETVINLEESQVETDTGAEEPQVETDESYVETTESQVATDESQADTPYSVDTYTVEELTVDTLSIGGVASKGEAPSPPRAGEVDSSVNEDVLLLDSFNPIPVRDDEWVRDIDLVRSGEAAQSQTETDELDGWLDHAEKRAQESPYYDKAEWLEIRSDARILNNDGMPAEKAVDRAMAMHW